MSDHYDAIVDVELPEHPVCSNSAEINEEHNEDGDYGEMEDGDMNEKFDEENTKHPTNQDSPLPPRSQDSPIPSRSQYSPIPMPRKKIKYQRNSLNLAKFENCEMEVVERMPWKVDGTKVFKIYCSEEHWHDAKKDLRYWVFTSSSRVGLPGIMKFGNCQGNFIYRNDECPKFTSKHVRNEIDFIKQKLGGYTCNSCGYYVHQKGCSAKKGTEFNCENEELTIYHEGHHQCIPKMSPDEAITVAQDVQKNRPISMELSKTPQQFQMDLLGYYVAMGQIEKVKEVA